MKNLKQLSRTSLRSISGGFGGESTCSTTCS
ncbi:bacteriocin-like protein, partial [Elizabethkingia meningoseptica]